MRSPPGTTVCAQDLGGEDVEARLFDMLQRKSLPELQQFLNDQNLDIDTQVMFDVISVCLACDRALQSNCIEEILHV